MKTIHVIDSSRSIANKVRFAMKRGLTGVAMDFLDFDDVFGKCGIDNDTFEDFKPIEGVTLKFPKRTDPTFLLLRTVNEAIDVTMDEIKQELIICPTTTTATTTATSKPTVELPIHLEFQLQLPNLTTNLSQLLEFSQDNNDKGEVSHSQIIECNAFCLIFVLFSTMIALLIN